MNNQLFVDVYLLLDRIREQVVPRPASVSLVVKEGVMIIHVCRVHEGKTTSYSLNLTFSDTLRVNDVEEVARYCVKKATKHFEMQDTV